MFSTTYRASRIPALAVWLSALASLLAPSPAASAERVVVNDNRLAQGTLANGTLTLRLEARAGEWHPDGETEPGITVMAFAAEGGPLQIPAPLVRVREGTAIHIVLRNRLPEPLDVHGLYSRPGTAAGDTKGLLIPSGEAREVTFPAGRQGTYYYWATTVPGTPLTRRVEADSQLSGALIVDPAGTDAPPDRVLLVGFWNNRTPTSEPTLTRIVINGLSWPHTERLAYRVGDTVRLRLINAGIAVHPMHLHGFYFNVDSRGTEREDTAFPPTSSPHMVVTERLVSGATFALTWKPTRPGNWLFHCHDNQHLVYGGTLDGSPSSRSDPHHHVDNHALEMMSGPIIGISVTGQPTDVIAHSDTPRRLRLIARVDAGGTDAAPAFAYALEEGAKKGTAPATLSLPGPTILLTRGQPVAITVVNELPEATAVHWHGIELESYFDGVAGFAGEGTHIAPAIAPGGSFEARFTPPRSGTFIYHTHIDEIRQQQAGLSGPLLVVDDPSDYDPQHDIVFMVTAPRTTPSDVVLINGSPTPPGREMRAGEHYRLRFISLHTNRPSMRMRVLSATTVQRWRALAKDGRDLPAEQSIAGASEVQMGNGETYDFDFVPAASGDLRLDVSSGAGVLLASLPIHVR